MSDDGAEIYEKLAEALVATEPDVDHGRMMSSPAVTVGGKVFAFLAGTKKFPGMGFRLGRDFDVTGLPDGSWTYLAPFRTKPPMRDWVLVAPDRSDLWPKLAQTALGLMRSR